VLATIYTGRAEAQAVSIVVDFADPNTLCAGPLCDGEDWTWPADASTWAGGTRNFPDPTPPGAFVTGVTARSIGCAMAEPRTL
jgi:hypothetical protein